MTVKGGGFGPAPLAYISALFALLCAVTQFLGRSPAVHRSAILKRCKDSICHFSDNNTTAFIFSSADPSRHLLSADSIPILTVQVGVNTTFVHIGNLFWRYILDLFLVCFCFLLLLFLIPGRLFFLVMLHRRSASRIPLSLHPNTSAISD